TDFIYGDGRVACPLVHEYVQFIYPSKITHTDGCPYHRHHPFGYHRPIEYTPALPFVLDAAGNEWRLRGVETGNGTTCNCDEEHWKNREFIGVHMWIASEYTRREFRDRKSAVKHGNTKRYGHHQKHGAKGGI